MLCAVVRCFLCACGGPALSRVKNAEDRLLSDSADLKIAFF